MKKTQTIILVVFGVFLIIAVLLFAGLLPSPERNTGTAGASGTVTIWGFVPEADLRSVFDNFALQYSSIQIDYVEKERESFDEELVNALASGDGPDLAFISQENLFQHKDRFVTTAFESFNQRLFADSFVQSGNLFLNSSGVAAFPLFADPLVMYYNRTLLENAGIATPPTTWEEVFALADDLTQFDAELRIEKSAVALGEYQNIRHAKDIIALLLLQLGNPLVSAQAEDVYAAVVHDPFNPQRNADQTALTFFSEFSNSSNSVYSWNKSLPEDRTMFTQGDLALYFGFASEVLDIQRQNPNLNFDVAVIPQRLDAEVLTTYADIYGVAALRQSDNIGAALFIASTFANNIDFSKQFSEALYLPSARRQVLLEPESDYYMNLFNRAALQSRSWLDPNAAKTDILFGEMMESILSGRDTIDAAAQELSQELTLLLN
jgi:ABC-type glycerol-3-phosphate transport system substrate-binding protein